MSHLITNNLATWTSAPNGIKKLRELILGLAVRGLLVPQNPDDEPASVLLEKIAAEKAQLCAEGKIKKSAPLPKIADDEKPFELPNGWEWARLGDITNYGSSEKAEPTDVDEQTWILELEDVEKETSRLIQKVRFVERQFKSSKNSFLIGDVIYGKLRPYLDKVIVADEAGVCTTEMIPVRGYSSVVAEFLRLIMKSPYFISYANNSTHGMSLPRMGTDKARLALIPILSENEQHRIVAKVDELMQLCDQLEQKQTSNQEIHAQLVSTLLTTLTQATDPQAFQAAWTRIAANFDSLFTTESSIEQLKQTILQLAVMGKLVEQEAGDEPASVLLEKIAQEKARLISEGKIKKSAPLPKISDDEKPFDLPIGWEWVRTNDVCESIVDCPHSTPKYQNDGMDCIDTTCFDDRGILLKTRKVDEITFNERNARLIPKYEDIVYSREGIIGQAVIVPKNGKYCLGQRVMLFRPSLFVSAVLLRLLITSPFFKNSMTENHKGIGAKHINMSDLRAGLIPLPPIPEQHRIVAKVDELMAFCDQLKTKLNTAQTLQQQLAETLVQQTVA